MNSAEERLHRVRGLMLDYSMELDELAQETNRKNGEMKEKYRKLLLKLLEEYS